MSVTFTFVDAAGASSVIEIPREALKHCQGALEALVGEEETEATIRIPDVGLVDVSAAHFHRAVSVSYFASTPWDLLRDMLALLESADRDALAAAVEWLHVEDAAAYARAFPCATDPPYWNSWAQRLWAARKAVKSADWMFKVALWGRPGVLFGFLFGSDPATWWDRSWTTKAGLLKLAAQACDLDSLRLIAAKQTPAFGGHAFDEDWLQAFNLCLSDADEARMDVVLDIRHASKPSPARDRTAFKQASSAGNMRVLEQLWEHRGDPLPAWNWQEAFEEAAAMGHLPVLEFLIRQKEYHGLPVEPAANSSRAFRMAAGNGQLPVMQWLWSLHPPVDPAAEDNAAFRAAAQLGRVDILRWLWGLHETSGVTIRPGAMRNAALTAAVKNGHLPVIDFLWEIRASFRFDENYWDISSLASEHPNPAVGASVRAKLAEARNR